MNSNKQIVQKQKPERSKYMMYEQQLRHLPAKTFDNLIVIIETELKPKRYACILHDKDKDKDGNPVEPHIHAMLEFETSQRFTTIAKKLGELDDKGKPKTQQLAWWDEKVDNGYSYLVHDTKNALGKHHYSPDEVRANFDFKEELEKIAEKAAIVKAQQETSTKILLDAFYDGSITKEELEKRLSGSQYGRLFRQIETIHAKRLQEQAEIWRREMKAKGGYMQVIWIWGEAGTGKTSFAKEQAVKAKQPYYLSGSSRDVFQKYSGEHTIILDEFRPNIMPYSDLLRIIDPNNIHEEVLAPARYNDKALACNLIIITSPYSPFDFYTSQVGSYSQIDNFHQLMRRISASILMTQAEIILTEFDSARRAYVPKAGTNRHNPYSSANRQQTAQNAEDVYNAMFD